MESMNWSKSAGSLARGFSGASFLRRGDENFPCAMVVVSFYRQGIVGAASSRPKADGIARLAEWEQLSAPTVGGGNHGVVPFNEVHSLSQPVRAASSLREGAKAAAPQREAKSLPYGGRRKSWGCTVQRSTLPQSARSGCQLPQRGSQGRFAPAGSRSLFPIHSYLLPTPTQVGAAGRVRELKD